MADKTDGPAYPTDQARAELRRRALTALADDDGEPCADDIRDLARRTWRNLDDRDALIALTSIIRSSRSARDRIEACALIAFAQRETQDIPVSVARALLASLDNEDPTDAP
jgi:hypothetical protein